MPEGLGTPGRFATVKSISEEKINLFLKAAGSDLKFTHEATLAHIVKEILRQNMISAEDIADELNEPLDYAHTLINNASEAHSESAEKLGKAIKAISDRRKAEGTPKRIEHEEQTIKLFRDSSGISLKISPDATLAEVIKATLTQYAISVHDIAEQLNEPTDRVQLLINNASILHSSRDIDARQREHKENVEKLGKAISAILYSRKEQSIATPETPAAINISPQVSRLLEAVYFDGEGYNPKDFSGKTIPEAVDIICKNMEANVAAIAEKSNVPLAEGETKSDKVTALIKRAQTNEIAFNAVCRLLSDAYELWSSDPSRRPFAKWAQSLGTSPRDISRKLLRHVATTEEVRGMQAGTFAPPDYQLVGMLRMLGIKEEALLIELYRAVRKQRELIKNSDIGTPAGKTR